MSTNLFLTNLLLVDQKKVLTHWDSKSECYVWSKPHIKLKGITSDLKKRFYASEGRPRSISKSSRTYVKSTDKWVKGMKGGLLVHEQVQNFVKSLKEGVLKKDIDPRTACILREVLARKWKLLEAEYCVGDKDLRIGTGIDLLCIKEDGNLCVIELKIGFDNIEYETSNKGRMRKPFEMMDKSIYSQHQLQLLLTKNIFEKMVGVKVEHAEVWVVGHPSGLDDFCRLRCFPLHPEIIEKADDLATIIGNTKRNTTKKIFYIKTPKAIKNRKN